MPSANVQVRRCGVVVLDPERAVDLALVADRLVAFDDDPDRCAGILADLLEVRRALAAHLIARHRPSVIGALVELSAAQSSTDDDPYRVREQDMAVAWAVVEATGNSVAMALLATVDRALDEHPLLVQAMYGEPRRNRESVAQVAAATLEGGADLALRIGAIIAANDARTVADYRRLLFETQS
jgi:DNA-binding FadR family transcriptional regulator